MSPHSNPPRPPVPRPPVAPQQPYRPQSSGTVYVRPNGGGGGGGWIIAAILLVVAAVVGAVAYFKSEGVVATVTTEAPVGTTAPKAFELPKIEENPEQDGERPIDLTATFDEDDFRFLPDENDAAEEAAAKNTNAEPEKEEPVSATLIRKEIPLTTPGLTDVPADRVVDVLCLFTTNYKNRYGGKGQKSLNTAKRITDMFRESNEKWQAQNGKQVAVRIVGIAETDYVDSWQVNDLNALNRGRITTVAGTPVHKLRAKVGADLVVLFGTKGGGGVSSGNAFFIVKRGHGVFTHECQHAFGWGHGEQLPDRKGDDVSKLGKTAPGRSAWMPKKMRDNTVYIEYRGN